MTRGSSCLVKSIFLFVPVALVSAGAAILLGSLLQTPGDRTAAAAYRGDASCSAPLDAQNVPPGACTVATATIQTATGGTSPNFNLRDGPARLPSLTLAMADGSEQTVGFRSDGFFALAYPGDNVRVQLFGGAVTRIGDRGETVETVANPLQKTAGDRELPYVGAGMLAIGIALLVAVLAARKREAVSG